MTGAPSSVSASSPVSSLRPVWTCPSPRTPRLLGQRELPFILEPALLVGLGLADDLILPLGERLELVADAGELFDGQLLLGVAAGLLEVVLGLFQVGQGLFLLLVGLFALVLVDVLLGLAHPARCRPARPRGGVGTELGQPLELPLEVLPDLGLLLGQALELLSPLLGIGIAPGLAGLLEVLGLTRPGLGELALGVLELLDQPRQLALAAVLDRVDQVADLVAGLLLARTGRAHLVALELLGGLAHLAGRPLLLALLGRLAQRGGGQRDRSVEPLGHLAHPLQQLLQARAQLALPRGEVRQLGLLLGGQLLGRLAHRLRPRRHVGGLLHRLLLLLEELLGVLDDAPIGLELAQVVEHLLELVGDRLLIRLRLGQRLASRVGTRGFDSLPG